MESVNIYKPRAVEIFTPYNGQWEPARVTRWHRNYGPKAGAPDGYVPVVFPDGGGLMVHISNIRDAAGTA